MLQQRREERRRQCRLSRRAERAAGARGRSRCACRQSVANAAGGAAYSHARHEMISCARIQGEWGDWLNLIR